MENPIAKLIYDNYEATQEDSRRPHLGASSIGDECKRRIWYGYRWVKQIRHSGKLLRLFETGKLEEKRVYKNLEKCGWKILAKQAGFSLHNGHFAGTCDGIVNVHGDSCLLEIKTYNSKSFAKLNNLGIPKQHYDQMTTYMSQLQINIGLYFAVCKDNDEIYSEMFELDNVRAEKIINKAAEIIYSDFPPEKISNDPAFYLCKMCNYRDICTKEALPERNCRTCNHSAVGVGWDCEVGKKPKKISIKKQKTGCELHRFMPSLIGSPVDYINGVVFYHNGFKDTGK